MDGNDSTSISIVVSSDFSVTDPETLAASVSRAARTLTPGSSGTLVVHFTRYTLEIIDSADKTKYGPDDVILDAKGNITDPITIEVFSPGTTYTAIVKAYIGEAGIMQAAEGISNFTAIATNGPLSVTLKPIMPNIEKTRNLPGFFSYTINAPTGYRGIVSLRGPRTTGDAFDSGNEVFVDDENDENKLYAQYAEIAEGTASKSTGNIEIPEGLYDFSLSYDSSASSTDVPVVVLNETVYIFPGLVTSYVKTDWGNGPDKNAIYSAGNKLFTGTLSIANADNYDLKDITIKAYKSGQFDTGTLDISDTALASAEATLSKGTEWNETAKGKAKFTAGFSGGQAKGNTVTVQWGMSIPAADINGTNKLLFKAFSSATEAGNPEITSDIYLASDTKSGTVLYADSSFGIDISAENGRQTGIILSDRAVGPPRLLSASIYDNAPQVLQLVFSQGVTTSEAGWALTGVNTAVFSFENIVEDNPSTKDVDESRKALAVGADGQGYAYIWKMKLSAAAVKDEQVSLGYTAASGTAANSYGVKVKDIGSSFSEMTNSVGYPGAAPPSLVQPYVDPSVTKYTSAELVDKRIGDILTLVFDQAVIMPSGVNANALGFALITDVSNGDTATPSGLAGNRGRTAMVDATRKIKPDGETGFADALPYYYDTDGTTKLTPSNTSVSNIWLLPLATTTDGAEGDDTGRYKNYFFVGGDKASLSYTQPTGDNESKQIKTSASGGAALPSFGIAQAAVTAPRAVVNNVQAGDWTAPRIYGNQTGAYIAEGDASYLYLSFTEPVHFASNNASASGFVITGGSSPSYGGDFVNVADTAVVSAQSAPAALWRLSLNSDFVYGNTANVSFSGGAGVYDVAGNYITAASLGGDVASVAVDNRIPKAPEMMQAVIYDTLDPATRSFIQTAIASPGAIDAHRIITVTFDKAVTIPTGTNAACTQFDVSASAEESGTPSEVRHALSDGGTYNNTWYLVMDKAAAFSDTIKLGYTDPGAPAEGSRDMRVRVLSVVPNVLASTGDFSDIPNTCVNIRNLVLQGDIGDPYIRTSTMEGENLNDAIDSNDVYKLTIYFSEPVDLSGVTFDAVGPESGDGDSVVGNSDDSDMLVVKEDGNYNHALFTLKAFSIPANPQPGTYAQDWTFVMNARDANAKNNRLFLCYSGDGTFPDASGNPLPKTDVANCLNSLAGDYNRPELDDAAIENASPGKVTLTFSEKVRIPGLVWDETNKKASGWTLKRNGVEMRAENPDSDPSSANPGPEASSVWTFDIKEIDGTAYTARKTDNFTIAYDPNAPHTGAGQGTTDNSATPNELIAFLPNPDRAVTNNVVASLYFNLFATDVLKGYSTQAVASGSLVDMNEEITWTVTKPSGSGTELDSGTYISGGDLNAKTISVKGSQVTLHIGSNEGNSSVEIKATCQSISAGKTVAVSSETGSNSSPTDNYLLRLYAFNPVEGASDPADVGVGGAAAGTLFNFSKEIQYYSVQAAAGVQKIWFAARSASTGSKLRVSTQDNATGVTTLLTPQGQDISGGNYGFFSVNVPASGFLDVVFRVDDSNSNGNSRTYKVTLTGSGVDPDNTSIFVHNNSDKPVKANTNMSVFARNADLFNLSATPVLATGVRTEYSFNLIAPEGWATDYVVMWTAEDDITYACRAASASTPNSDDDFITNITGIGTSAITITLDTKTTGICLSNAAEMKGLTYNKNYVMVSDIDTADTKAAWVGPSNYTGKFFGNRYTALVNLTTVTQPENADRYRIGLFHTVHTGSAFYDLNVNANTLDTSGNLAAIEIADIGLEGSAIVGCSINDDSDPLFENCHVAGNLSFKTKNAINDQIFIGGLIGIGSGLTSIKKCSSDLDITIYTDYLVHKWNGGIAVGVLWGRLTSNAETLKYTTGSAEGSSIGSATDCYGTGNITVTVNDVNTYVEVGGLGGDGGKLTRCWYDGKISFSGAASSKVSIGGLCGGDGKDAWGWPITVITNSVALSPSISGTGDPQINRIASLASDVINGRITNCYALPVGTGTGSMRIVPSTLPDADGSEPGDLDGDGDANTELDQKLNVLNQSTDGTTDGATVNGATILNAAHKTQVFWTTLGFSIDNWDFSNITTTGRPILK